MPNLGDRVQGFEGRIHGAESTVRVENKDGIHVAESTVRVENEDGIHVAESTVRVENEDRIHGAESTVRVKNEDRIHVAESTVRVENESSREQGKGEHAPWHVVVLRHFVNLEGAATVGITLEPGLKCTGILCSCASIPCGFIRW